MFRVPTACFVIFFLRRDPLSGLVWRSLAWPGAGLVMAMAAWRHGRYWKPPCSHSALVDFSAFPGAWVLGRLGLGLALSCSISGRLFLGAGNIDLGEMPDGLASHRNWASRLWPDSAKHPPWSVPFVKWSQPSQYCCASFVEGTALCLTSGLAYVLCKGFNSGVTNPSFVISAFRRLPS